jgi:hypothetical protein
MPAKAKAPKKWSQHVTETSNAMDIEDGTFASDDPVKIARRVKKDAEASNRRKSSPYRAAMSMLTFYINRAGKKPHAEAPQSSRRSEGRIARAVRTNENGDFEKGAAEKEDFAAHGIWKTLAIRKPPIRRRKPLTKFPAGRPQRRPRVRAGKPSSKRAKRPDFRDHIFARGALTHNG